MSDDIQLQLNENTMLQTKLRELEGEVQRLAAEKAPGISPVSFCRMNELVDGQHD